MFIGVVIKSSPWSFSQGRKFEREPLSFTKKRQRVRKQLKFCFFSRNKLELTKALNLVWQETLMRTMCFGIFLKFGSKKPGR